MLLQKVRELNKKIYGIKVNFQTLKQVFKKANYNYRFYEFQNVLFEILKIASKLKKRVVIGTTGFTKNEEKLIKRFSKKIPILKAGNMSLGINLLMYLTEIASSSLGK